MIDGIGGPIRVSGVYGRQQFYAERAVELKIPKTTQVGAQDRVTFSPEAQTARNLASPGASVQAAISPASVFLSGQMPVQRPITYEDPRRAAVRHGGEEAQAVEFGEPDSDEDDISAVSSSASSEGTDSGASSGGGPGASPR
ncbi:MAG: hypothetical protein HY751_05025 [Nitrospinae bacterium]|nr:hypothetical protein [Nitrospinota bacterium]